MFGFMGGESAETVARKKVSLKSARERWHFLTSFDQPTGRNRAQLGTMIRFRSSLTEAEAAGRVDAWLRTQPTAPAAAVSGP